MNTGMDQHDLHGQVCLVTGATSGIGLATATQLAARGAHVLAVARDPGRRDHAVAGIREQAPDAQVTGLCCDLARLDSVRALGGEVEGQVDKLDVLINNAGVSKFRLELTPDGFETTFAVNHLAPFLLTNLLIPVLKRAGQARVVAVSSDVHKQVHDAAWLDDDFAAAFRPLPTYQRTKLMNIWFVRELARRVPPREITANCVSPGFVRTGLAREATGGFKVFTKISKPFQKSPASAAQGPVHLACAPDLANVSGAYFRGVRQSEPSAVARDDAAAAKLWSLSARLCNLPVALP